MWVIYSIISNLAIMLLEYLYRSNYFKGFWGSLHILIFPIMTAQWALYYLFKTAPSLVLAGASFTVANAGLRLINSWILGENLSVNIYIGVIILVIGVLAISYGK